MRRGARGFTLVELLIALVLVTLIVTMLFGSIRLGNRSWNAVEAKSERYAEMRLIWRFLHDRIGQTREIHVQTDDGRTPVFYGDRDALEFASPMPAHLGVSGLYLMRLHVGRDDGLKLTRWLYHADILEGDNGIPEWETLADGERDPGKGPDDMRAYYSQSVLVDGVETFELEYFGVAEGETEPTWSDEWEEPQLPELVRLRIGDAKGDWPELVLGVGG